MHVSLHWPDLDLVFEELSDQNIDEVLAEALEDRLVVSPFYGLPLDSSFVVYHMLSAIMVEHKYMMNIQSANGLIDPDIISEILCILEFATGYCYYALLPFVPRAVLAGVVIDDEVELNEGILGVVDWELLGTHLKVAHETLDPLTQNAPDEYQKPFQDWIHTSDAIRREFSAAERNAVVVCELAALNLFLYAMTRSLHWQTISERSRAYCILGVLTSLVATVKKLDPELQRLLQW